MRKKVKLGADPEISLLSFSSSDFPPCRESAREVLGEDSRVVNGSIGCDGHAATGELRPNPSVFPERVVDNISSLIHQVYDRTSWKYLVTAGSLTRVSGEPLGGHIHFSKESNDSVWAITSLLNWYLSVPLLLFERVEDARNRRGGPYGRLGDIRDASHGGWEYRTPPSWILNPLFSKFSMSIAEMVADAVVSGTVPKNIRIRALTECPQEPFKNTNKPFFRKLWQEQLYPEIKRLPLYPKFRLLLASVNSFLQLNLEWKADQDLAIGWGFRRTPLVLSNQPGAKALGRLLKEGIILFDLDTSADFSLIAKTATLPRKIGEFQVSFLSVESFPFLIYFGGRGIGVSPRLKAADAKAALKVIQKLEGKWKANVIKLGHQNDLHDNRNRDRLHPEGEGNAPETGT